MKKSTHAQVVILVLLLVALLLFLGRVYGSYIQIWNILTPLFVFLCAIGLFLLSYFIARNVFKSKRSIDYYVLISCLTILFYAAAWVMLGFIQDSIGVQCVGLFGADISCVNAKFLPVLSLIWPVALGAIILPILAYVIFGKEDKRKKGKNVLLSHGSVPTRRASDLITLIIVGIVIAIVVEYIIFRAYFHIDWSSYTF